MTTPSHPSRPWKPIHPLGTWKPTPYSPAPPTFVNRIAAWVLYSEENAQRTADYGKHYILFPKLQPGAEERQRREHHKRQMIEKSFWDSFKTGT